jgi:hypothetical protein
MPLNNIAECPAYYRARNWKYKGRRTRIRVYGPTEEKEQSVGLNVIVPGRAKKGKYEQ